VSTTVAAPKSTPAPRQITTTPRFSDKVFRAVVTAGGLSSLVILGLIAFFLVFNGFETFRSEGLSFLTGFDWMDAQPEEGIAAGTLWSAVPESWACPDCGVAKADFEIVEI
jgi:phosphate transport system permease protein